MIARLAGTILWRVMLEGISTSHLNRLYPDEWVLAEVIDTDMRKRPTRVRVIAHSQNRQDIHSALMRSHGHLVLLYVAAPSVRCVAF